MKLTVQVQDDKDENIVSVFGMEAPVEVIAATLRGIAKTFDPPPTTTGYTYKSGGVQPWSPVTGINNPSTISTHPNE